MRRWMVGLVGVIAAPLLMADSCSSANNSGTAVNGSSSPSGAQVQTFHMGDAIKVGGTLVFTVSGVARDKVGSDFEKPAKGEFLIVQVSFRNDGSSAATVSSLASFDLRDDTGQSYTEALYSKAGKPPDGEIAAHDKLAGALSYDVPPGHAYKLYFKNDLFAAGQVIVDLGSQ